MRCLCIAASISSKVQSWCSATRARMRSAYFSRTEQLPPRGFGSLERSSRQRCTHLMAELTLISNKSAASRRDAPASTVPITRSRRSPEYDCGIVGPHRRINAGRLAHFNGLGNPPPPRFRFGGKCCKKNELHASARSKSADNRCVEEDRDQGRDAAATARDGCTR